MTPEIEQALTDLKAADLNIQIEAAHILGDAAYKPALPDLLKLIRTTPSEIVKAAALSAIANIDPHGFYGHLLALILELTGAERGFVALPDPLTGDFTHKSAVLGMPDNPPDEAVQSAIIKETVSTGKTVVTDNASQDQRFQNQQGIVGIGLRSIAAAPIRVNNEVIGVIYTDQRIQSGMFNQQSTEAVNHLLVAAGEALEELYTLDIEEGGERKKELAATTSPEEFDEALAEAILDGETDDEMLSPELEDLLTEEEEEPAPTTIPGDMDDGLFGGVPSNSPGSSVPQAQPPKPIVDGKTSEEKPDFDNMSPAELMTWMENLAKQQETVPLPQSPPVRPAASAQPSEPPRQQHQNAAPPSPELNHVRFSAYYPKEVAPGKWYPLNAYVFKSGMEAATQEDAQKELGPVLAGMRRVAQAARQILREGVTVTATPMLPGFQFNPPNISVGFFEDWHRFAFKMRATDSAPKFQAANGFLTFTVEGIIVADIPLAVFVGEDAQIDTQTVSAVQDKLYKAIFCSYSRRDTRIIERVERAYKALGYDYLRDINTIKSGQDWDARLYQMIEDADIFQLFWSGTAAASPYVEREWRHALTLGRDTAGFIRPVWWEQPMPSVPPELGHIHFAYQPDLTKD